MTPGAIQPQGRRQALSQRCCYDRFRSGRRLLRHTTRLGRRHRCIRRHWRKRGRGQRRLGGYRCVCRRWRYRGRLGGDGRLGRPRRVGGRRRDRLRPLRQRHTAKAYGLGCGGFHHFDATARWQVGGHGQRASVCLGLGYLSDEEVVGKHHTAQEDQHGDDANYQDLRQRRGVAEPLNGPLCAVLDPTRLSWRCRCGRRRLGWRILGYRRRGC